MNIPFIDLPGLHKAQKKEIESALLRIARTGTYVLGEDVELFEKDFARFTGAKFCVGVANGTDGLLLALRAMDIGPGDEVITVSHTFIATALAITYAGATPVFVDVHPDTCNIDETKIEAKITKRTKAILPVALYGQMPNMTEINNIAKKYKLQILLDACQAHGALHNSKPAGYWSDVTVYSFYPTKNLGAYGDGGAVITSQAKVADHVRLLRNVGRGGWYEHPVKGVNSRLDSIQAAILRIKLKKLDTINKQKREKAAVYNKLLKDSGVLPVSENKESYGVYYLYVIRSKKRDKLQKYLTGRGIHTAIHYPIPIHLQPAYPELKKFRKELKNSEMVAEEILSLPFFPHITRKQQEYVAREIRKFEKGN